MNLLVSDIISSQNVELRVWIGLKVSIFPLPFYKTGYCSTFFSENQGIFYFKKDNFFPPFSFFFFTTPASRAFLWLENLLCYLLSQTKIKLNRFLLLDFRGSGREKGSSSKNPCIKIKMNGKSFSFSWFAIAAAGERQSWCLLLMATGFSFFVALSKQRIYFNNNRFWIKLASPPLFAYFYNFRT